MTKKGCKVVTQETNQTWEIKHNQQEQWRQVKPEDWFKTFWSKLPNFSLANDHMQRACCACHYAMCHTHLSSQWLTSWTSRHFLKMKYKLITGLGSFFFSNFKNFLWDANHQLVRLFWTLATNQLFKDCFADCLEGLPIGTFRPSAWFILRNLTLDYLMQCWYISIYNYIYIRYIDMSISISL